MIKVSSRFKKQMEKDARFYECAEVTLSNGEKLSLDENHFTASNNSITDGAGGSNFFPIGVAVQKYVQIEIVNDCEQYKDYDFFGAKIRLFMKLKLDADGEDAAATETVEKGTYTVISPETYGETIIITAYDDMYKADAEYKTNLTFPNTAGAVLRDICSTTGMLLGNASFLNDDFIIQEKPDGTFRQIIGYIAGVAAGNARIDTTGKLQIMTWNLAGFSDTSNYHLLKQFQSPKLSANDILITGVKTVIKGDSTGEDVELMAGTADYTVAIENPLLSILDKQAASKVLQDILTLIGGFPLRPFEGDMVSNPLVEFMDLAKIEDRRGNQYNTVITDVNFVFMGFTTVKNTAPGAQKSDVYYKSPSDNVEIRVRKLLQKNKTEWERAADSLSKRMDEAGGTYTTIVTDEETGAQITYTHNKPKLEESNIIWKETADARAVSTDGGKTWNAGITVDGTLIAKILYAIGINADWIRSGSFTVADDDGNILFLADKDTNQVILSGDSVRIGGKTATAAINDVLAESKDYADGKLADFAQQVQKNLDNLEIGGRNLLLDSAFPEGTVKWNLNNAIVDTTARFKGNNSIKIVNGTTGRLDVPGQYYSGYETGRELVLTFWLMSPDVSKIQNIVNAWIGFRTVDYTPNGNIAKNITPSMFQEAGNGTWFKVEIKGSNAVPENIYCTFMLQPNNSAATIYVSSPKLEYGTKPTDWTPAPGDTESYADNLAADLQTQIDGKIQTYNQTADPSSAWTTTALKNQHTGDLWYNPNTKETKRWSGTAWTKLENKEAEEAGALAQKKAQVFTGTPTAPYYVGDLWFDSATSDIMTCVTSRTSGNYTASDWAKRNKYTDDTKANEALGEARKSRNLNIILDNEYQGIPVDYQGNITSFPTVKTYVQAFYGHTDVSADCSYSVQESEGVTGTWDNSTRTYTVRGLTADTGWVDITATYLNALSVTKRFNVAKIKDGQPGAEGEAGRTYFMEPSTMIVKRSQDNSIVPNYITLNAYYRDGADTARAAYAGRFKIEESLDGNTWTTVYTSSADESSITHSLYSALATTAGGAISTASGQTIGIPRDVVALRCTLYAAGGTTQMLDIQSIAVVVDVDALTAEQVLEILSGGWQGIYSAGNKYYISAEFIKAGEMLADRIRGGTLTLGGKDNGNGVLKIVDASGNVIGTWDKDGIIATGGTFSGDLSGAKGTFSGELVSPTGNIGGWTISGTKIISPDGSIVLDSASNVLTIGLSNVSAEGGAITIRNGLTVYSGTGFSDGSDYVRFYNLPTMTATGGRAAWIYQSTLHIAASSSKRYKNHVRDMELREVEGILKIPVVWFKYKDDYLTKNDPMYKKEVPGLYAEDVYAAFPEGVSLNDEGQIENWNERTLVPAMLKLIQEQQKEIEELKRKDAEKEEKLEKLEELLLKREV